MTTSAASAPRAVDGGREELSQQDRNARLTSAVRTHFPFVWTFLRRVGVPEGDVADAAQAVFVVFSERFDSIAAGAEKSFLYSTARRAAANVRRRARAHARAMLLEGAAGQPCASRPDEEEEARRARAILDKALLSMPVELRVALILAEVEGMNATEISAVTHVPSPTVRARLRRARTMFRYRVLSERRRAGLGCLVLFEAGRGEVPPAHALEQVLQRLGLDAAAPAGASTLATGPAQAPHGLVAAGIACAGLAAVVAVAFWVWLPGEPVRQIAIAGVTRGAELRPPAPAAETSDEGAANSSPEPVVAARPRSATVVADAGSRPVDPLIAEVRVLDRIRAMADAGRHSEALALLGQYERDFPAGKLSAEAGYLRVKATLQAGDREAGQRLAQEWLKRWPHSPLGSRVRELAGPEVP